MVPQSRILSQNDPRLNDSEKYLQWKEQKEKQIIEEKRKEKKRQELVARQREEQAEQRKADFEYYAMVRDFELLVERLVHEAVDKAEKRLKESKQKLRKSIAMETMTNWQAMKQEQMKAERKNEKMNKMLQEHLTKSELLETLKIDHQRVLEESWNFQKWFEKQVELRQQNIIPYLESGDDCVSALPPSRERPASSSAVARSRTKDGFYTLWDKDRRLVRKLKKDVKSTTGSKPRPDSAPS